VQFVAQVCINTRADFVELSGIMTRPFVQEAGVKATRPPFGGRVAIVEQRKDLAALLHD